MFLLLEFLVFFFSSRRRHTRLQGDWSSDVCSSDLTIFICRSAGRVSRRTIVSTAEGVAGLVKENLEQLRVGGLKPTRGDARCIAYGHLIRLAIWNLRSGWVKDRPVEEKIRLGADAIQSLGGALGVEKLLPN